MKIKNIRISNFIGARRIELTPQRPVVLIAGPNGAAKSSIHEAIRLAFTSQTLRVELKRDYPLMISDGAKEGAILVETDMGSAFYTLPKGEQQLGGDLATAAPDALPFVLNAQAFASLPVEQRRSFLFLLTNCNVTGKEVKRRLLEKKCDEDKVDMVLPMMKSGFPAAAKFAGDKVTEARGAWKAIAGEVYGSKKGEVWEAFKPEVDAAALTAAQEALAKAEAELSNEQQALGGLKSSVAQRAHDAGISARNRQTAEQLPTLREQLTHANAAVVQYETSVKDLTAKAGTGPRAGLVHDMATFINSVEFSDDLKTEAAELIGRYETQHGRLDSVGDETATKQLPAHEKSLKLAKENVERLRTAIARAELAKEAADKEGTLVVIDAGDDTAVKAAQAKVDGLAQARFDAQIKVTELQARATQAATADDRTKNALAEHEKVLAWMKIAEQLAPDGIPAELLAQALKPVNKLLQLAATNTGWKQPRIEPDMSITADGRPYPLLCESEKWRVDAMIAATIAELSDVRVLLLDRMDVLEIPARGELIMWLDALAESGAINSAIVTGTLKSAPGNVPDNIEAIWMEDGVIAPEEAAEAA